MAVEARRRRRQSPIPGWGEDTLPFLRQPQPAGGPAATEAVGLATLGPLGLSTRLPRVRPLVGYGPLGPTPGPSLGRIGGRGGSQGRERGRWGPLPPPGRDRWVEMGRRMAARRGWTGQDWRSLYRLWQAESGWNPRADNPTSSAYGIPQGLTALHDLGAWYVNNPRAQIRWGLNYIANRYGDPTDAWSFWTRNRWY